jgi:DNA-binding NarL/FixJ family response regulator
MATLSAEDLNERQKQILELIAVGLKDAQIAKEMQLSLSSVSKRYICLILVKK